MNQRESFKSFEDWWVKERPQWMYPAVRQAQSAWNYQQRRINTLTAELKSKQETIERYQKALEEIVNDNCASTGNGYFYVRVARHALDPTYDPLKG